MEALQEVEKIVRWYKASLKKDGWSTTDIDALMYAAGKLASHLYYLAQEVGNANEQQNTAKYLRDSTAENYKYEMTRQAIDRGEKPVISQIETAVNVKITALIEQRLNAESVYEKIKLLYYAACNVHDQMRQDISMLKMEKGQEYNGTGSQNMPTG